MRELPGPALNRRRFLQTAGVGVAALGSGLLLGGCSSGDGKSNSLRKVSFQANFLVNTSQLGEVTALKKGFYKDEGLDVQIIQGGPSVDPTATVVGRHADLGVFSSSPALFLGVSEGRPVKCFATAAQRHPYAYFSLPDKPVREPHDLIGKKVGVNQTGVILLDALLKKNGISKDEVEVVTISGEITPLLTGQVDVWTGWVVQQGALKQLPEDYVTMTLWDAGIKLYALGYFATEQALTKDREMLEAFLRGSAKGWHYARQNTDEAIEFLVSSYKELDPADEAVAAKKILDVVFPDGSDDFGAMDSGTWEEQMQIYDELDMFKGKRPAVDDVITLDLLKATEKARTSKA